MTRDDFVEGQEHVVIPPWPEPDEHDPLPDEPLTELGYARRLIHTYGNRLRYVPAWRKWLLWDGTRWGVDDTGQVARWTKIIARQLTTDALAIIDATKRRTALAHTKRGESAASVHGALTLASTEAGIAVTPDRLDADPFLLNTPTGTLDLRTLQLHRHDPADLITKITGAGYDPGASVGYDAGAGATLFARFLERMQPTEDMRTYLARLLGHALEGRVVEHVLPIFFGAGANGKSTFVDAVLYALGDYGSAADPDLLTARTFAAHPTGTADLFGRRLAILHESDAGRRLAEGTVKRLTGGDRIKARRMREDFWSFDPSHTFLMLTNHKPLIHGTDEGIWRRLRLVPWDVVIPTDEQDTDLGDRLRVEADGILSWLVDGYRQWKADGLADPEAVIQATDRYRSDSDAVGRFIGEKCAVGRNYMVRSSVVFAAWSRWAEREGVDEPRTNKAFTTALQERGFDTTRERTGMVWRGIGLVDGE